MPGQFADDVLKRGATNAPVAGWIQAQVASRYANATMAALEATAFGQLSRPV